MKPTTEQTEALSEQRQIGDQPSDLEHLRNENEALRHTVASLERELVEVQARTDAQIAKWQERAYWLDRWHLDLNALMNRPGAKELLSVLKVVRAIVWELRKLKRKVLPAPPRMY